MPITELARKRLGLRPLSEPILVDKGKWDSESRPLFKPPTTKTPTPEKSKTPTHALPQGKTKDTLKTPAVLSPNPSIVSTPKLALPAVPAHAKIGTKSTIVAEKDSNGVDSGVILIDPQRVKPFPYQPRKRFRGIEALARSIKAAGQAQAGEVTLLEGDPDFDVQLTDGERRLRACLLIKQKFRATIGTGDRRTLYRRSAVANYNKENHDCLESMGVCQQFREDGETIQSTADILGKSAIWVSQHLSLLKLHPDVQALLVSDENEESEADESGRGTGKKLTFALALLLTLFPHDLQKKAANEIISTGMSYFSARRYVKQLSRDTGHQAGNRPQTAREKLGAIQTLTKQSIDKFGLYLDMTPSEIEEMFQGKTHLERLGVADMLSRFENELHKLIERIKHPPA